MLFLSDIARVVLAPVFRNLLWHYIHLLVPDMNVFITMFSSGCQLSYKLKADHTTLGQRCLLWWWLEIRIEWIFENMVAHYQDIESISDQIFVDSWYSFSKKHGNLQFVLQTPRVHQKARYRWNIIVKFSTSKTPRALSSALNSEKLRNKTGISSNILSFNLF